MPEIRNTLWTMMKRWLGGVWNVPGARWENTEDEASPCPPDLPPWYTQGSNHHHHISLTWSHIIRKVPKLTQVVTITYVATALAKLMFRNYVLSGRGWSPDSTSYGRGLERAKSYTWTGANTQGLNLPSPNHHHQWSMMIITFHQTNDIHWLHPSGWRD